MRRRCVNLQKWREAEGDSAEFVLEALNVIQTRRRRTWDRLSGRP